MCYLTGIAVHYACDGSISNIVHEITSYISGQRREEVHRCYVKL